MTTSTQDNMWFHVLHKSKWKQFISHCDCKPLHQWAARIKATYYNNTEMMSAGFHTVGRRLLTLLSFELIPPKVERWKTSAPRVACAWEITVSICCHNKYLSNVKQKFARTRKYQQAKDLKTCPQYIFPIQPKSLCTHNSPPPRFPWHDIGKRLFYFCRRCWHLILFGHEFWHFRKFAWFFLHTEV